MVTRKNNQLSDALSMDVTEEVYEYFGTPRGSFDMQAMLMNKTTN